MNSQSRKALLAWYDREKRELPWRQTRSAYAIWVSEIMCQQTQVATVEPYFRRWMDRFPDVSSLAKADPDEVAVLWQGLGYYRRARLLQAGAQYVVENGWPSSAAQWRQVPGVGRYTAGAIASISLGESSPVVDGNVKRVYSRFANDDAIGSALEALAWSWADSLVDPGRPGDWNQALMELGATVCTPANPACLICPLLSECGARAAGRQNQLPVAKNRAEPVAIDLRLWVPVRHQSFGVVRARPEEWWHGLYVFPHSRSTFDFMGGEEVGTFSFVVTRHRVQATVALIQNLEATSPLEWFDSNGLEKIAMPTPHRRALALACAYLRMPSTL